MKTFEEIEAELDGVQPPALRRFEDIQAEVDAQEEHRRIVENESTLDTIIRQGKPILGGLAVGAGRIVDFPGQVAGIADDIVGDGQNSFQDWTSSIAGAAEDLNARLMAESANAEGEHNLFQRTGNALGTAAPGMVVGGGIGMLGKAPTLIKALTSIPAMAYQASSEAFGEYGASRREGIATGAPIDDAESRARNVLYGNLLLNPTAEGAGKVLSNVLGRVAGVPGVIAGQAIEEGIIQEPSQGILTSVAQSAPEPTLESFAQELASKGPGMYGQGVVEEGVPAALSALVTGGAAAAVDSYRRARTPAPAPAPNIDSVAGTAVDTPVDNPPTAPVAPTTVQTSLFDEPTQLQPAPADNLTRAIEWAQSEQTRLTDVEGVYNDEGELVNAMPKEDMLYYRQLEQAKNLRDLSALRQLYQQRAQQVEASAAPVQQAVEPVSAAQQPTEGVDLAALQAQKRAQLQQNNEALVKAQEWANSELQRLENNDSDESLAEYTQQLIAARSAGDLTALRRLYAQRNSPQPAVDTELSPAVDAEAVRPIPESPVEPATQVGNNSTLFTYKNQPVTAQDLRNKRDSLYDNHLRAIPPSIVEAALETDEPLDSILRNIAPGSEVYDNAAPDIQELYRQAAKFFSSSNFQSFSKSVEDFANSERTQKLIRDIAGSEQSMDVMARTLEGEAEQQGIVSPIRAALRALKAAGLKNLPAYGGRTLYSIDKKTGLKMNFDPGSKTEGIITDITRNQKEQDYASKNIQEQDTSGIDTSDPIAADIVRQLTDPNNSRPDHNKDMERSVAEVQGNLYATAFNNLSKVVGVSPAELWDQLKPRFTWRLNDGGFDRKTARGVFARNPQVAITPSKTLEMMHQEAQHKGAWTYEVHYDYSTADIGTVFHEQGHFFTDMIIDLAQRYPKNRQLKQWVAAIKKYAPPAANKQNDMLSGYDKEKMANGYMRYALTGESPNSTLRQVFDRFLSWIAQFWNSRKHEKPVFSQEVREIFDYILAAEPGFDATYSSDNLARVDNNNQSGAVVDSDEIQSWDDFYPGEKEDGPGPNDVVESGGAVTAGDIDIEKPEFEQLEKIVTESLTPAKLFRAKLPVTTSTTNKAGTITTIRKNVDRRDTVNPLRAVSSPSVIAKVYEKFEAVYIMGVSARRIQDKLRLQFAHQIDKIFGKPKLLGGRTDSLVKTEAERSKLNEVLIAGDAAGVVFTDENLKTMGANANVTKAYKAVRGIYNRLEKQINNRRDITGKEAMAHLEGYIPHFFKNWRVHDAEGVILNTFKTLAEATKFAESLVKGAVHVSDKTITIRPAMQDFGGQARIDATTLGDIQYFNLIQKIEDAFALTPEEANDFADGVARMANKHRVFDNAKFRQGMEGFDTDMEYALRHYANLASRYIAMDTFKVRARGYFERVFGRFDRDHKGIARYTKNYINDVLGVPTAWEDAENKLIESSGLGKLIMKYLPEYSDRPALFLSQSLRSKVALIKLGFLNISSALINLSSLNGTGAMVGYGRTTAAVKEYLSPSLEIKKLYTALGLDTDITMESASSYSKLNSRAAVARRLGNQLSSGLFTAMDSAARKISAVAGYRKALAEGKTQAQAYAYARDVVDKTNFNYGVEDSPSIFRSTGGVGETVLQFKKYPIKLMELGFNHLEGMDKAKFWAGQVLLSGVIGAIPGFNIIREAIKALIPEKDMEMEMKNLTASLPLPNAIKRQLLYGGMANLGMDISSRVGVADILPSRVSDALGPGIQTIADIVRQAPKVWDGWGGALDIVQSIVPGIANPLRAFYGEIQNPRTGQTQFKYEDNTERALRATGIRPIREAVETDAVRVANYVQAGFNREQVEAIDTYIEARKAGAPAEELRALRSNLRKLKVTPARLKAARRRARSTNDNYERAIDAAKNNKAKRQNLDAYASIAQ